MRDFVLTILSLLFIALAIKIMVMDVRMHNIEQTVLRCEMDYQEMASNAAQLERINAQNLSLMAGGGWDDGSD